MENVKVIFGKNLRKYRKMLNFSQESLAEILDISARHLSYIETARAFPSPELLQKISETLGVAFSALFYDERESFAEDDFAEIDAIIDKNSKNAKSEIREVLARRQPERT